MDHNSLDVYSIGKTPEELQSALIELRNDFDSHLHDGTNSRTFQTVSADTISAGVVAIRKNNFSSDVSGMWMGVVSNQMKFYLGNAADNIKWTPTGGLQLAVSTSGGITILSSLPSAFMAFNSSGVEFRVGTVADYDSNATILLSNGSKPYAFTSALSIRMGPSQALGIVLKNTSNHVGNFSPESGSAVDLGTSSLRWTGIYLQSSPDVSSDARVKTAIKDSKYGLDTLLSLRAVQYKRKDKMTPHVGFIAQEMINQIPEIVGGNETDGYSMRYEELIPVLTKAIQELNDKFEAYKLAHP